MRLTYPPDIDAAWEQWRANCGPCAMAAILGTTLSEVHPYFEGFEARGYCNVTHMQAAVALYPRARAWSIGANRPRAGLIFVQWGGHEAKPIAVQYRYTHWIAVQGDTVFEVNAPELVCWEEWTRVMPEVMRQERKGDGTFRIRTGLEVRL